MALIDVKEAVAAAAPRYKNADMPRDNGIRIVEGARHLSPRLVSTAPDQTAKASPAYRWMLRLFKFGIAPTVSAFNTLLVAFTFANKYVLLFTLPTGNWTSCVWLVRLLDRRHRVARSKPAHAGIRRAGIDHVGRHREVSKSTQVSESPDEGQSIELRPEA